MANIKGRVVDYDTDIPMPDVDVLATDKLGVVIEAAKTNSEGIFDITSQSLDDPAAKITFSKDGYATQTMRAASADEVDVPLPKAGTLGVVVVAVKRNKTKAILFVAIGALAVYLYMKYGKTILK